LTINEAFVKFLMKKYGLTFDAALAVYKEYLEFRDGVRSRGGKK